MLMDLSTMNVIPMENVIVRSMCKETNVTQLFLDGTNLLIPKVAKITSILLSQNSNVFHSLF